VSAERPAGERCVVRRGLHAWLAPGIQLADVAPGGDPDRLLTRPDCEMVKLQQKVAVGVLTTPAGRLYIKRYNVFAWRVALGNVWRRSPALGAWRAAHVLGARGFATPEPLGAVEVRRAGILEKSFFVTREVPAARTADQRWQAIVADPDGVRRRAGRRALARALGDLFRRLHAAGVYHNDLKDVNVLVDGPVGAPRCVLLDLERVRTLRRVGHRRRVKNLMQLARTLGPQASATDRLRFLAAYLGPDGARAERRKWVGAVGRAAARKGAGRLAGVGGSPPRVSCTVIAQDEERMIEGCLASVAWCDELVVVDGGSSDRTVAVARRFTDRVLFHAWPGHRAQKQFALDAASGEWVLNLDADERVSPELATEIRRVLARVPAHVGGFAVPRLVAYLGRWWYRGGWYPRPIVRLVRRSATRWGGTDPHERAEVTGDVRSLRAPIIHYTYRDISDHLRSINRLTTVAAAGRAGRRVGLPQLVLEPLWRFVRAYLVTRGAADGFAGLFVAGTGAFYVFLRAAKVWELQVHAAAASAKRGDGRRRAPASS